MLAYKAHCPQCLLRITACTVSFQPATHNDCLNGWQQTVKTECSVKQGRDNTMAALCAHSAEWGQDLSLKLHYTSVTTGHLILPAHTRKPTGSSHPLMFGHLWPVAKIPIKTGISHLSHSNAENETRAEVDRQEAIQLLITYRRKVRRQRVKGLPSGQPLTQ